MEMQNVMKNCPKIVKQSHFLRMATTNLRHHSAFFVQRKFICLFYVLLDLFSVWALNWCPVQEIGTMQDYLNCVLSKGFWPRMHFSRKARVQGLTNNLWSFPLPNKHKLTWRGAQTSHSQMCQYFHQGKPQYWIWICPPSFWILWSSKPPLVSISQREVPQKMTSERWHIVQNWYHHKSRSQHRSEMGDCWSENLH